MNSSIIEYAVAKHFGWRECLIVPNVSWGFFTHEVDIAVLKPSGYCWEVEGRTSVSDTKNDLLKRHRHESNKIARLYFAIPETMTKAIAYIPERAGILGVGPDFRVKVLRAPRVNKCARKLEDSEIKKLYHLAAMRTWTLKLKLLRHRQS